MPIHATVPLAAAALAFASLTLIAATPTQAPGHQRPEATKAQAATSAATFEARSQPWQRFVQQAGGEWTTRWCTATGTPRAIFGTGLPIADWRDNSLAEARRHAQQLLQQEEELLGLGASEFREIIGSRMGRTWCFVFDQFFRGLPVIDGRADVRVHMVGRISMFGSTAWPVPADFVTVPLVDKLTATSIAWQTLAQVPPAVAQPGSERQPRLVIWGDRGSDQLAPVHLAWEVPISAVTADGQGPVGRYYIDARTADVLAYTSDKHECGDPNCRHIGARDLLPSPVVLPPVALPPSTGIVMAWTRLGASATASLSNVPLAADSPYKRHSDCIGTTVALAWHSRAPTPSRVQPAPVGGGPLLRSSGREV